MTPPPEPPRPGYLRRVLADGARRPQRRRGVRGLLGAEDGGFASASRGLVPGFVYAHVGFRPIESGAESPDGGEIRWLDVPDARTAPVAPAPTAAEVAVPAAARAGGFDPPAPASGAQARAATKVTPAVDPAPAIPINTTIDIAVGDDTPTPSSPVADESLPGPTRPPRRARIGRPPPVGDPAPDPAAGPADPTWPSVQPAPRPTRAVMRDTRIDADPAGPARTLDRPEPALDVDKLSAPMRALLPLLGRVRVVPDDSPPDPDPTGMEPGGGMPPRVSTRAPSSATTLSASDARRSPAPGVNRARARPPVAPAEPAAATAAPLTSVGPSRPVSPVPAARRRDATRTTPDAPAPASPPPRRVEHVVTTRVVYRTPPARAFWERRYLGRPHMRPFR